MKGEAPLAEPRLSLPAAVIVAASLHLITAVLGIQASRGIDGVAPLWFGNAIAVAILLNRPRRHWAWVLAGVAAAGVAANVALGNPPLRCLVYPLADVAGILTAAELLRRGCRIARSLDNVGDLVRLQLLGGVLPALAGASVAVLALLPTGPRHPLDLWLSWLEASVIGSVSVLPLGVLLAVRGGPAVRRSLASPRVLAVVAGSLALTLWAQSRLPQAHVYVILGLAATALVGRFPGSALAVLVNAVALLLPAFAPPGGAPAADDVLARGMQVLPVALTLTLPMLLAVALERIRSDLEQVAWREQQARLLYRRTPVMMYTLDRDRRVQEVSDAWLDRMGYRREQVVGRPSSDFMTAESCRRAQAEVVPRFAREGAIRGVEYQLVTAHGDRVDVEVAAIGEHDSRGGFVRTMAVFQDVTERKRLAGELAREQERIAVTLHAIGEGVVITDERGLISYLNPVAEQLLGWTLAEARGMAFAAVVSLFDQATRAPLVDPVAECLRDARAVGLPLSAVMRNRHGREYAIEDSVAPILGGDGQLLGTVMVFQDVTEQRELSRRMSHLALHDPLTDLPNRVLFHDRVQQLCQFARRDGAQFAVMFMDLDHFKRINDSLGHVVGDELLKTVALRLRQALRESDTVCRLGGDEFVVLLADVEGPEVADRVARKMLEGLAQSCVLEGTDVRIGVSMGIAMFPEHGVDPATLMKRADAAMYRAKRDGRNRLAFWSRDMDAPAAARLQLEADIRRGIAAGEFTVHYQPVVSAGSRAPVSVEALARWMRGPRGIELPETFIPVAEESGLIVEMGAYLLRQACAQLGAWAGGPLGHLRIAVNVSALQLSDPDFVAVVTAALADAGVPGQLLEIEMTESTLSRDPERAMQVLAQLKRLGVRIAIDDFGTGYSSLSNLRLFPLDVVKIDRSFVADLESDADDRELVNAILAMSRSLRLDVVAEGVERDSQATILSAMKCPAFQGYLFSVPADAEHMTAWLSRRDSAVRRGDSPQASLFG